MYSDKIPKRVRALILGGGIHGVGVLHDLASRGWSDIHLVEKSTIGCATSSSSTKLIHGGLRYLKRIRDFGLVSESLHERKLLLELVPDLVHVQEFIFPILKQGGMGQLAVKAGLSLYDLLSGRDHIPNHRKLSAAEATEKAPILDTGLFKAFYSYCDGQTDDLGLVYRIAASARKLGGSITEGALVEQISPDQDGFRVKIRNELGEESVVSARYIVNCTGPWANRLLEASGLQPTHRGINNKGTHIVLPDYGLTAGLFLQSPDDNRIFFVLPWLGKTLVGTTEELFQSNPDDLEVEADEVAYLLERCNRYLSFRVTEAEIESVFSGLRWLAVDTDRNISETTRSFTVGEINSSSGLLMTIYGGKLTSYRSLCEKIGDRICDHFGEFRPSTTDRKESWARANEARVLPEVNSRFSVWRSAK